ncbi:MAG TPA: M56 family metallopeptidase, partial [Pyrinomonadaceae bacterium]|nr:M56 family metallopeptidase [Pyrinomonadaceae bacterium]
MYFLIGTSLLFTFMLAVGVATAALLNGAWKIFSNLLRDFRPETRARITFTLRILPIAFALTVGLAFIVPSFVLYEPQNSDERVGAKLAVVIGLAMFGFAAAAYRIFASWWRTRRLLAKWRKNCEPLHLEQISIPVFRLRHRFPVFAIVGAFRPRLFIADQVLETFDDSEITAVVHHELGHISAFDNLKKLTMKLCGDLLVVPVGRSLDRDWSEASESAADEFAVSYGDRSTALNLAGALIKIARAIPNEPELPLPAVSYVYETTGDL